MEGTAQEGMAQVGRAEEVVARPPEKLKEGKPEWRKSNLGKEGAEVASQAEPWKVRVRFPTWYKTPTRRRARRP